MHLHYRFVFSLWTILHKVFKGNRLKSILTRWEQSVTEFFKMFRNELSLSLMLIIYFVTFKKKSYCGLYIEHKICYWIVICLKCQIELAGLRWNNVTDCLLIIQYRYQFQTWSYKQNAFTSGDHMFWESVNSNFSQMPYVCNKVIVRKCAT